MSKNATKNMILNRETFRSLSFANKYNPAIKLARITGALKLIKTIADNFTINGDFLISRPFGSGHINDTRLVTFTDAGNEVNYIFRKINKIVFKNPETVVNNTLLVTNHIRNKLEQEN